LAAQEDSMFRVEIRLADEDRLVEMVTTMRTWLDEHGFAPLTFGYSLASARVVFRVVFTSETEAAAFATAFDGTIVR
jgi:hypothetical protein